jgi:tRNA A64-2'-O-ribosylphosphate transferase
MPIPPSTSPISLDSLIFPAPSHSFSKTLTLLKQSRLSIGNRLRSILEDAEFVLRVADTLKLPLVANERCGSWYVPPEKKAGSTYFKSTDGHAGQWKFSTRRLNLQLLEVVERSNGCVLTARGCGFC